MEKQRHFQNLGKGAVFSRTHPVLLYVLKGDVKGANRPGKDIEDQYRLSPSNPYEQVVTNMLQKRFNINNPEKDFIDSIPISLPYENVYDNIWVGRQETQGKKADLVHECQHIPEYLEDILGKGYAILSRAVYDSNSKKHTEQLYVPPEHTTIELCNCEKCKPVIQFRFFIRGGLENYGVCGFSTNSVYDVSRIPAQLLWYDTVLRQFGFTYGIARVPLMLERVTEMVTLTTPKTGSYRGLKSLVNIRLADDFLQEFPVFSTPPLLGVPKEQQIQAPFIKKDTQALIQDMLRDAPQKVVAFTEKVLQVGIRFNHNTNTVVPVTEHWLRETLIPKIEKAIHDAAAPEPPKEPEKETSVKEDAEPPKEPEKETPVEEDAESTEKEVESEKKE